MKHYIKPEFKLAYLDSEVILAGSDPNIEGGGNKGDNWEGDARERNSFFDVSWGDDK